MKLPSASQVSTLTSKNLSLLQCLTRSASGLQMNYLHVSVYYVLHIADALSQLIKQV